MDCLSLSTLPLLLLLCLSSFATFTLSFNVSTLSFDDAYDPLFGDGNLVKSPDGKSVSLILDRRTGSGFISKDLYSHGLFSASIKLPSDYTAGIVVAFYTSNGDIFEKTHDELDFEFLGNIPGKEWRIQTNVYGNGSTYAGREERYLLWFDPSEEFHRYSILWTDERIVFYIDEVPIREVVKSPEMGGHFPVKPMSLYATIWDASNWATSGGRYKVNYKYAPFVSQFTDLVLQGCAVDPIERLPVNCNDANVVPAGFSSISPEQRSGMRKFRQKYMTYSYCYDRARYPTPLPECVIVPAEQNRFRETGHLKFGGHHRHGKRRHARNPATTRDHHSSV